MRSPARTNALFDRVGSRKRDKPTQVSRDGANKARTAFAGDGQASVDAGRTVVVTGGVAA